MINALIKNGERSTSISMPTGRREMAEKLYHIGVNISAEKILCIGLNDLPIKVELTGDTEMETKLIAILTEWDTVGGLNGVLSRFYALPMQNRQECEAEVLAEGVANLPRFCECLSKHLPSEIEVKYYCPLKVMLYNVFGTLFERVLPASSVANCYPFNYSGKTDPNGFYIGKDKFGTNIIVDFDRRSDDKTNANILILGNSGHQRAYIGIHR